MLGEFGLTLRYEASASLQILFEANLMPGEGEMLAPMTLADRLSLHDLVDGAGQMTLLADSREIARGP